MALKINAVIVEDEPHASEHLQSLIHAFCENIHIIGTADNVKKGYATITDLNPDVVFLDIEMPDGTGFDLLKKFDKVNFFTIFTTAYSRYAIQAFKYSAISFLLKPIDPEELIDAVIKAGQELKRTDFEDQMMALFFNLQGIEKQAERSRKVVLSTNSSLHVINSDEIVMCQSDKNHTQFFMLDGRIIIISKTIKEFDDLFNEEGFFRPHKQYLININHIKKFEKSINCEVTLTGGLIAPVSVRKKEQLINLLIKMNKSGKRRDI